MRKLSMFYAVALLSMPLLFACQRDESVRAGSGTYQPRAAPTTVTDEGRREISGQLIRLEVPKRTFSIRLENGMEQTFQFDDTTTVLGLEATPAGVRELKGNEGSEVRVGWQASGEAAKMATHVEVTDLVTRKNSRKSS
jgi:hypothetical protein